jgi:hypothetical protein
MKTNWTDDVLSETNAAIVLLGAVLGIAAIVSAALGHQLAAAWLVAAAITCLTSVLFLMYVKVVGERDAEAAPEAAAPSPDAEAAPVLDRELATTS